MQDITKNFTERINRLETLFGIPENHTWSVVTFNQRIGIKRGSSTFLAEGFRDVEYVIYLNNAPDPEETERPEESDDDEPPTVVHDFTHYDQNIVGYYGQRVLILLELDRTHVPQLAQSLVTATDDNALCVDSINLPPQELLGEPFRGTLYRIEGDMFPKLWYENNTADGDGIAIGNLRHNWVELLEEKLHEQVHG